MLNFFATWCPPCRQELPRVQKEIWDKYKDNPRFALMVFGREEGWDKVLPFKTSNNYTFSILPDEGRQIFGLFAKQSIPRNVILDETGKIIYQSTGYSEQEFNKLLTLLNSRLSKTLP
jgi:thiol-disulfide isomerase/thioredoxin